MSFKNQLKPYKKEVLADAKNLGSSEAMYKWGIASRITWHKLLEDWGRPDLKYKVVINTKSPLDDIKVIGGAPLIRILDSYIDVLKASEISMELFKGYLFRLEMENRAMDEEIKVLGFGNGKVRRLLLEGNNDF